MKKVTLQNYRWLEISRIIREMVFGGMIYEKELAERAIALSGFLKLAAQACNGGLTVLLTAGDFDLVSWAAGLLNEHLQLLERN